MTNSVKKTTTTAKKNTTTRRKVTGKPKTTLKIVDPETQKTKQQRIAAEVKRLNAVFKDVDSEKKRIVKATIEDAAFLSVTMQDLRDQINEEGTEVEYQNGANQWGKKQSPAVLNYLHMSQKLAAVTKILQDCLPKAERKAETDDDRFDDFVETRGDGE